MRLRAAGVVLLLLASPVSAIPRYVELEAMVKGPWIPTSKPATMKRLNQDQAGCRLIAMQTPVDSTTPAIVQMVRWAAEINCMNALGYETMGFAPSPKINR